MREDDQGASLSRLLPAAGLTEAAVHHASEGDRVEPWLPSLREEASQTLGGGEALTLATPRELTSRIMLLRKLIFFFFFLAWKFEKGVLTAWGSPW